MWLGCASGSRRTLTSRLRQLHRAVDLSCPEFARHGRASRASSPRRFLSRYPTAASYEGPPQRSLARIIDDGSYNRGRNRAL